MEGKIACPFLDSDSSVHIQNGGKGEMHRTDFFTCMHCSFSVCVISPIQSSCMFRALDAVFFNKLSRSAVLYRFSSLEPSLTLSSTLASSLLLCASVVRLCMARSDYVLRRVCYVCLCIITNFCSSFCNPPLLIVTPTSAITPTHTQSHVVRIRLEWAKEKAKGGCKKLACYLKTRGEDKKQIRVALTSHNPKGVTTLIWSDSITPADSHGV